MLDIQRRIDAFLASPLSLSWPSVVILVIIVALISGAWKVVLTEIERFVKNA